MRHLIVAEDNDLDVERLRRQLRKLKRGEHFVRVDNGDAALATLADFLDGNDEPVTLLADLNMPGMNGWDLIEAVRFDDRFDQVAIFVCTTSTHPTDIARAEETGVDGYIVKPVQVDDLIGPLGIDGESLR